MARLEVPRDRPPIFIGAGIIKEEGQILHVAPEDSLAAVIVGSFTDPEWAGNDEGGRKNVEYWDEANRAYYNSIGLKNPGRKNATRYLPTAIQAQKDAGQLAIISVTTLKDEDPTKVLPDMVEWALEMGADGVEVNGSCQNISPEHPLLCRDVEGTGFVLSAIRSRVGNEATLGYKVSPMDKETIVAYGAAALAWDFYDVTNTKGNQPSPLSPITGKPYIEVNDGLAGQSGPIIAYLSRENLENWVSAVGGRADVLSMGGVDSWGTHEYEIYSRVHKYGALMVGGAQEFRRAGDVRRVAERWAQMYVSAQEIFGHLEG